MWSRAFSSRARKVENLLAPGRHLSTDDVDIDWLNLIPQRGLYTAAAKAAAEHRADLKAFRQDHNDSTNEEDGKLV